MSIDALITGKLRSAPVFKKAANGSDYCTFKLATTDKNGLSILCGCITFSNTAMDALEPLSEGDSLSVSGEASISTWISKAGETKNGLDVMVHLAQSVYHSGRKRVDKPKAASQDTGPDGFDD